MTAPADPRLEAETPRPQRRPGPSVLRSPLMVVGLTVLGLLVFVAVFAPLLATHDPKVVTGAALERPSARHWLGTNDSGRDLFSQLVYGTRVSLLVGSVGPSLALLGAVMIGVLPALIGGRVDRLSNRFVVFLLALPGLPLLVLIGALVGQNQWAIIIVIATGGIAPNARILRAKALSLREAGFISAARGFGGGPFYVLRRHFVPGLGPLILVGFVTWASTAIALEAGLAFLGLGDPSGVSWGLMLERGLSQRSLYFSPMWTWWVLPPGIAITIAVMSFTFVGVALEPTFNPRWLRSS